MAFIIPALFMTACTALGKGAFAALQVAAVPFVLRGIVEPSIRPQPVDYAIWFAIVGLMGTANSTAIYAINTLIIRIIDPVKKS